MTSALDGGKTQHVAEDAADCLLIALAATREAEHDIAKNLLAPVEKRRGEKFRAGRKVQRARLRATLISLQWDFYPAILAMFGVVPGSRCNDEQWWHNKPQGYVGKALARKGECGGKGKSGKGKSSMGKYGKGNSSMAKYVDEALNDSSDGKSLMGKHVAEALNAKEEEPEFGIMPPMRGSVVKERLYSIRPRTPPRR